MSQTLEVTICCDHPDCYKYLTTDVIEFGEEEEAIECELKLYHWTTVIELQESGKTTQHFCPLHSKCETPSPR